MGSLIEPIFYIIRILAELYIKIVIIEIVLHWLIHFGIIELNNKYVTKTMELLEKATHPVYKKIGEKVPPVSGFDFSPFILLLALIFVARFAARISDLLL